MPETTERIPFAFHTDSRQDKKKHIAYSSPLVRFCTGLRKSSVLVQKKYVGVF